MNVLNVAVSALLGAATVASFVKAVRADRRARERGESRLTLEVMDRYREATRLIGEANSVERAAREASAYLRRGYGQDGTAPRPRRVTFSETPPPEPRDGDWWVTPGHPDLDPDPVPKPATWSPDPVVGDDGPRPRPLNITADTIDASKIRAGIIRPEQIIVRDDLDSRDAFERARDAWLARLILPPDHPDYTTPGDPT